MMYRLMGATIVVAGLAACGEVAEQNPDAATTLDACVPETDPELCGAAGCEAITVTDRCGAERTVDCGTCDAGQGCSVNQCVTPVCTTFDYRSETLAGFSRPGIEDTIGAVTPDGGTIVFVATRSPATCGAFDVIVADEMPAGSGSYQRITISEVLRTHGMTLSQFSYALSADGLTLVTVTSDAKSFAALTRSARLVGDFGPPSATDFAAINAAFTATQTVYAPVLSADALELYFTLSDAAADATAAGIYVAVRTSTAVPFPAASKVGAPVGDYQLLSGLSSDRLTAFVFDAYNTRIFTRSSTNGPWLNPNAPAPAPVLPSWELKPFGDCARILATDGSGGCANEEIILLQRQ